MAGIMQKIHWIQIKILSCPKKPSDKVSQSFKQNKTNKNTTP